MGRASGAGARGGVVGGRSSRCPARSVAEGSTKRTCSATRWQAAAMKGLWRCCAECQSPFWNSARNARSRALRLTAVNTETNGDFMGSAPRVPLRAGAAPSPHGGGSTHRDPVAPKSAHQPYTASTAPALLSPADGEAPAAPTPLQAAAGHAARSPACCPAHACSRRACAAPSSLPPCAARS